MTSRPGTATAFVRALLPSMRRHGRWLGLGALAALGVVAARLALPWPVRRLTEHWLPGGGTTPAAPLGLDPVAAMGALLFFLLVLHGLADMLARLYFARFSIGAMRELRDQVFRRIVGRPDAVSGKPGDLVARLVGDIARVQVGLKGFLVHVATNGIMVAGVTVVLLVMDVRLGLIFGAAGLATGLAAALGARRILRKSMKHRRMEGKLANALHRAIEGKPAEDAFVQLNRSSGHQVASVTQLVGLTTWAAHAFFGLGVLVALWTGARAIQDGTMPPGDMVVFVLYALMMRGPMVRLARQGARTGKILGTGARLAELLEEPTTLPAGASDGRVGPTAGRPLRVLFTGYAPVHFLCFRPLFDRLAGRGDVEVFVSGGLRTRTAEGTVYDATGMYSPLGVPSELVLPVEAIRDLSFDILFAANTKLIEPGEVGERIQIFHGMSFRNKAVRPANASCDHYFVLGPYMRRRFLQVGLFEPDDPRLLPIGFMKTDALLDGSLDRATLLARYGLDGARPVILYAPTGQKHNSLETFGPEAIGRLAASGRYDILVKLHDHPRGDLESPAARLEPHLGERCRRVHDLDVVPLLFLADLLISDASSVTNEYTLLDRPMVFLDVPELIARARGGEDSMIDETVGRRCGFVVERPETIEETVARALAHPEEGSACRRAMSADLFFNPGRATLAAMTWLEERYLGRSGIHPTASWTPSRPLSEVVS